MEGLLNARTNVWIVGKTVAVVEEIGRVSNIVGDGFEECLEYKQKGLYKLSIICIQVSK